MHTLGTCYTVIYIYTRIVTCIGSLGSVSSEMEFLDISSTKDSSLLLHVFHSPFYWRFSKKIIHSSLVLKSLQKNPQNKKT